MNSLNLNPPPAAFIEMLKSPDDHSIKYIWFAATILIPVYNDECLA